MKVLVLKNGEHEVRDIDLKLLLGVDATPRMFTHFLDVNGKPLFDGDLIKIINDDILSVSDGTYTITIDNEEVKQEMKGRIHFNTRYGTWCFTQVKDSSEMPDLTIESSTPVPGMLIKTYKCTRCQEVEVTSETMVGCNTCGSKVTVIPLSQEGTPIDVEWLSH